MFKRIIVFGSLLLFAASAHAQAPRPPRPPRAPRPPVTTVVPHAGDFGALADLEDLHIDLGDLEANIDVQLAPAMALKIQPMIAMVTENARALADRFADFDVWDIDQRATTLRGSDRESVEYARGTSYLDRGRYDQALAAFDKVIAANGKRTDGAMYWKAYALNRLGRRPEALVTLDELLKKYPSSRWANDARALQVEVRQASGRAVNPSQENDEDLKMLALNGLVMRDPDHAIPMVEQILSGSASPRMKERALFLLAQSASPRAKTMLTDIAKGKGNPDLQMKALEYLSVFGGPNVPLLMDVYKTTPDVEVKKRVIRSLALAAGPRGSFVIPPIPPIPPVPPVPPVPPEGMSKAEAERMQAEIRAEVERARAEAEQARAEAERGISEARAHGFGSGTPGTSERDKARQAKAKEASDALWQLYQSESSVDLKREILRNMFFGDQSDRVAQVARTEKDPVLRQEAVHALMFGRSPKTAETLAGLYRDEKDPSVKRRIVDALTTMDAAGPLVQIARQETDPQLRKTIVERLSMMKDKEATDYLMELLKK